MKSPATPEEMKRLDRIIVTVVVAFGLVTSGLVFYLARNSDDSAHDTQIERGLPDG